MAAITALRPDSPDLADLAGSWRSGYVHIPFCARLCPYCDFAVVVGSDGTAHRYVSALLAEIELEAPWQPLQAIYVGGGTPSRLHPAELGRVITALRDKFGLIDGAEVSLEANPEDWSSSVAAALRRAGFNRVSFGAQSFDPPVLHQLGRRHTPDQIAASVAAARREGFASVNLDLIFGTPGETAAAWEGTLLAALELEPDHISTYALTVERGTALGRSVAAGGPAPDPDDQAEKWEMATEMLSARGLVRYEVSNHSKPGHTCAYNLSVWDQGEYVAFGLGAHGHRDGRRRRNFRRLEVYLKMLEEGRRPEQGITRVLPRESETERLLLGLRRSAGVETGAGGQELLSSGWGRRLLEAGVLVARGDRLVVARPLLTDEVSRALLAARSGEEAG